jgi:hypothetical protein
VLSPAAYGDGLSLAFKFLFAASVCLVLAGVIRPKAAILKHDPGS